MREPRVIRQRPLGGRGGVHRVEGVVDVGGIEQVEVVGRRHHAVVAGMDGGVACGDSSPRLDHGLGGQLRIETFVPTDGPFAEPLKGGEDVPMEGSAIATHLVAAEVDERVGEDLGEFPKQRVDGAKNLRVDRVQASCVNAEARAWRHNGAAVRAPFRVRDQPARGVAGDIEFRNHADGAVGGIGHQGAQVLAPNRHRRWPVPGRTRIGSGIPGRR